jgi:hypothetical protein
VDDAGNQLHDDSYPNERSVRHGVLFVMERKQIVPQDRSCGIFIEPNPTSAVCALGRDNKLFPNLGSFPNCPAPYMLGVNRTFGTNRNMKEREKKVANGYAGYAPCLRCSEPS